MCLKCQNSTVVQLPWILYVRTDVVMPARLEAQGLGEIRSQLRITSGSGNCKLCWWSFVSWPRPGWSRFGRQATQSSLENYWRYTIELTTVVGRLCLEGCCPPLGGVYLEEMLDSDTYCIRACVRIVALGTQKSCLMYWWVARTVCSRGYVQEHPDRWNDFRDPGQEWMDFARWCALNKLKHAQTVLHNNDNQSWEQNSCNELT